MEKWLFDFDDFMGHTVVLSSFSGDTVCGTFSDYSDDWIEITVNDGETVTVPVEPVRNIRIIESITHGTSPGVCSESEHTLVD